MTTIDYKKDTGKFKMLITANLEQGHIDLLKRFIPTTRYERVEHVLNDMFPSGDTASYQLYYDLKNYGLLENVYCNKEEREVVRVTDWGKVLLNQL